MSIYQLILLIIICFSQSMIFTMVSRSRNSGNPTKHFIASIFSNLSWFLVTFVLLLPEMMSAMKEGDVMQQVFIALLYALSSAGGSVTMMLINLGYIVIPYLTEEGASKVGANKKSKKDE